MTELQSAEDYRKPVPRQEDSDIREITVKGDDATLDNHTTIAKNAPGHPNNSQRPFFLPPTHEASHESTKKWGSDDSRKSKYVQQMFREKKFFEYPTQNSNETIRFYGVWACRHSLSKTRKVHFLVHVSDGSARRFFFKKIVETVQSSSIVEVLLKNLSDARQRHAKGRLKAIRLRSSVEEKNITDVFRELTKLVTVINILALHGFPAFRLDLRKVDHFPRAVTAFQTSLALQSRVLCLKGTPLINSRQIYTNPFRI